MDVNNTRFHLLKDETDWTRYYKMKQIEEPLGVRWDNDLESLTLMPRLSLFPRGQRATSLQPAARRSAAVDRYGNWYWISNDQQQIFWLPSGDDQPYMYWTQTETPQPKSSGAFQPLPEREPAVAELTGLAVTDQHYLIVGNVTEGGVFLFDLHAGGEPLSLHFPAEAALTPFDMAAAPGGGVWILDRIHQTYWGLDHQFRIITEPAQIPAMAANEPTPFTFHPEGELPLNPPRHDPPQGFSLAASDPISIEALPDGSVLILDNPLVSGPSRLYHYRFSRQLSSPFLLPDLTGIATDGEARPVIGHDMAYTPADDMLYIVERDGNQAVAFQLKLPDGEVSSPPSEPLTVKRTYLPMHFFGSRALVASADQVYYDVTPGAVNEAERPIGPETAVRWVALHGIDQPRYERTATLLTYRFDGKERDCVWHRLFLDACIPAETNVAVWTRAGNDEKLLEGVPFRLEPALYLRQAGAEIPYYEPFPETGHQPEATGTWELLFQQARGRYCQIKLVLSGNGRVTPQLRALRAYYPRFSYPKRFLPAVYQQDDESAWFLERLLANPEGFYTEIEGKMAEVNMLFDGRSAPAEALNWLAGWLGLILDPLWARIQERRQTPHRQPAKAAPDRRRLFIRYALALYERRGTPEGIRFALQLLLHPCLETILDRFKAAAVKLDLALQDDLAELGLSYPTAVMSEAELERLLHDYILAPSRPTKVRIVEHFLTRQGRAGVAGDPTRIGVITDVEDAIQASAHQFSVLIPEDLTPEEAAMVERIVALEKPAHTHFDIRRYWDYFRVGEVRLGIDTALGEAGRFEPMILGRDYLAEGYLYPAPPMDVSERLVSDRDRLGKTPL